MYRGFTESTVRQLITKSGLRSQKPSVSSAAQISSRQPKQKRQKMPLNEAEMLLAEQLRQEKIIFLRNLRFSALRKYELDFALLDSQIGIEIDGGIYDGRAHGSIAGILRDMEKHNLLTLLGWRTLRYTPAQVKNGEALYGIKQLVDSQNIRASAF
jgi:very-short-patch-repair endonuclease